MELKINKKHPRVAFLTLGCKVNQYETDLMMKQFLDNDYTIVSFEEKADIAVINSCSVTNLSTRKTRQCLSKAKRNGCIVVLAGCYAQEIKEDTELENVDIVIGNEEKKQVVSYVEKYLEEHGKEKKKMYQISDIAKVKTYIQKDYLEKGIQIRESVKIEDGCNNFCSYCIIPYVRGRVRSRSIEEIKKEIQLLIKSGVGEVVLVGIEIASYGKDFNHEISLIDVVEEVAKIPDLKRIRLGSLEPRILTEENIVRLSKVKKLCPHFHISVQSLNNQVLKRMNRKYTREDIFKITDRLREVFEDVSFTCDIIVGFPGETDEEFEETLEGVKHIQFYEVHAFKYSKRKWTRAATMENQVDPCVAHTRSETLIRLAKKQKEEYIRSYLGKNIEVLLESYSDGYAYGYTKNYMRVKIETSKKYLGTLQLAKIIDIEKENLIGRI